MINSLECSFSDGSIFRQSFRNKVVHLSGNKLLADSVLMAIEKCIAEDSTDYYRVLDSENGVPTLGVSGCVLSSKLLGVRMNGSAIRSKYGTSAQYAALRYVSKDSVRLVLSPRDGAYASSDGVSADGGFSGADLGENGNDIPDLECNLLTYSHALTDASWCRLSSLMNELSGGNPIMTFDKSKEEVKINIPEVDLASSTMYVILSEAFRDLSGMNMTKVILLSDIPHLTDKKFNRLLSVLNALPGVGSIFYYRDSATDDGAVLEEDHIVL